MTEDEAKGKVCCGPLLSARFAMIATGTLQPVDSKTSGNQLAEDNSHCIASACMAWRWNEAKRTEAFSAAVVQHMRSMPKPDHRAAVQAVYAERGDSFERTEGFCGLAGAPQ